MDADIAQEQRSEDERAASASAAVTAESADAVRGPRRLLRRLREAMAEPLGAQEQLDSITRAIAANLQTEVCSVYVLRDDDVL